MTETIQQVNLKEAAQYYQELLGIALSKVETGSVMVCGPLGDPSKEEFNEWIAHLNEYQKEVERCFDVPVFDQTTYHDAFYTNAPKLYKLKFEIFYKGLIEHGVAALYVTPGWEQSSGVRREIKYAQTAGKPVYFL